MYKGYKISVAMTTYNGERFIEKQLLSIINQTVLVDEIIISDDGSNDSTIRLLEQFSKHNNKTTSIVIYQDNPQHGIAGNFSWAIGHATGDIIFISGQDDVWTPEKVEQVINVFVKYPDAELVCHNLDCIDQYGNIMVDQKANSVFQNKMINNDEIIHVDRDKYLDAAISGVLISGPAASISRQFALKSLPIPFSVSEDWWLQFCAIADNKAYYLHSVLTYYRIHDSTTHSVGMSFIKHIKKSVHTISNSKKNHLMMTEFSKNAIDYIWTLPDRNDISFEAYRTLNRVNDVGQKVNKAYLSNRIKGSILLTKLFFTDIRYRRMGYKHFLVQLISIIVYKRD